MLAQEDGRGKKGKCPKCAHLVVVPRAPKNKAGVGANKMPLPNHSVSAPEEHIPKWSKEPSNIPDHPPFDSSDDITDIYEEKLGFLIPNYDELSLFLMAAAFILLYFTNSKMQTDIRGFLTGLDIWRRYIYITLFLVAMLLCIYHVFTSRKKTDLEKGIMMLFAVTINAATSIIAGIHMIKGSPSWLLIFPIWNIINGVLLVLMLRFNIIDENCISDRDATITQAIFGLASVFIIFILCSYVFDLYWAITFSICIVYTTSFDRALQNVFQSLTNREDEQAS